MKVIYAPVGLRLTTLGLSLSAPLAAAHYALAARVPWWRLPQREMLLLALLVLAASLFLRFWLVRGHRWTFYVTVFFAVLWSISAATLALHLKLPSIGFFTVFLLLYFTINLGAIWREIRRSYFDPEMSWYQGLPRPIPELLCELRQGAKTISCRVGRVDREGVILYAAEAGTAVIPEEMLKAGKISDLLFYFKSRHAGKKILCQARPIRELWTKVGAGFQFRGLTPDTQKELGQFIEGLRGEGYVE